MKASRLAHHAASAKRGSMMRFAGLVAGLLLAVPVLVVSLAYLARRRVMTGRGGCGTPMAPGQASRSFLRECAAVACLLALSPFRWNPSQASTPLSPRGTVVLLPDLGQPAVVFWLLRRHLRRNGWASVVGATHTRLARMDAALADLERGIVNLGSHAGPLLLIGHGTGGLLARAAVQRPVGSAVRQIITIAAPYEGTESPIVGLPGFRQLALGSELLRRLADGDRSASNRCDRVAIYSDFDATLVPVDAAYDPAAFNISVRGVGHFSMLTSRRIFDLIAENLPAPPSQASRR